MAQLDLKDTGVNMKQELSQRRENITAFMNDANIHNKINRYRINEGLDYLTSGIVYIFMVKPHLNLANNSYISDAFLSSIAKGTGKIPKFVVNNLDGLFGGSSISNGNFINIITNCAESFETKDNVLKTREVAENRFGQKIMYGDNFFESSSADQFTIQYTELNDLSLTYLHKTWVDYIHAVKINKIQPYRDFMFTEKGLDYSVDYVKLKRIDYATSLYYFLTEVDGTTIKYFAKYTGVFPISVPYSAMSFNLGESKPKQLSVQYQYSFKEDLDPRILDEFSLVAGQLIEGTGDPVNIRNNWCRSVRISTNRKQLLFTDNLGSYVHVANDESSNKWNMFRDPLDGTQPIL